MTRKKISFRAAASGSVESRSRIWISTRSAGIFFRQYLAASRFDALQMQNDAHLFRSAAISFSACAQATVFDRRKIRGEVYKVAPYREGGRERKHGPISLAVIAVKNCDLEGLGGL